MTTREMLEELLSEAEMIVRLAAEENAPNRELAFIACRLRFILEHGDEIVPAENAELSEPYHDDSDAQFGARDA